jgi:hypothetical protein
LGWDQGNQLNSYQMKHSKNQEITAKIGSQGFSGSKPSTGISSSSKNQNYDREYKPHISKQPEVLKPINSSKMVNAPYGVMEQKDPRMAEC